MNRLWLACLATLLAAAPPQDFDKSKHPWTKWKEGSYAKLKMSTEMGEMKQEGSITYTLTKLTDKDFTVSTAVEAAGNTHDDAETEEFPTKAGEETLTVDGKKFECVIWKSKGTRGGSESETKVWVPKGKDFALKITTTGGQEVSFTAVKLGEKVKVMEKEFDCVRLEGTIGQGGSDMKATIWTHPSIPGGMMKGEMKLKAGEQEGTITLELVEMKAEKK
ncbi:MAG: hypothetical protein HYY17_14180 [Planctomycetes bacterium]|nr:hypothetical protein [Planctomycetota bacterium]